MNKESPPEQTTQSYQPLHHPELLCANCPSVMRGCTSVEMLRTVTEAERHTNTSHVSSLIRLRQPGGCAWAAHSILSSWYLLISLHLLVAHGHSMTYSFRIYSSTHSDHWHMGAPCQLRDACANTGKIPTSKRMVLVTSTD